MTRPLSAADLAHVIDTCPDLDELDGRRVFITGGTGFFGVWLLETLAHWLDSRGARAEVVALTRDAHRFRAAFPWLAMRKEIRLVEGDVRALPPLPDKFDCVIHGATSTTGPVHDDPRALFATIVDGTRNVIDAVSSNTPRFLFISSGAVYGRQPPCLVHTPEDHSGAPDPMDASATYGAGKRAAEQLTALASRSGMPSVVARAFAFIGPHLPLDAHFAAGNFIRDALQGRTIHVAGDGTPYRSYLHAADLASWLWTLLMRGRSGRAYNVGSDEAVSIAELARLFGAIGGSTVELARVPDPGRAPDRYVPSIARAREELGLDVKIPLRDAVVRTLAWHRSA